MTRHERTPFSFRPEGPRTPAEQRAARDTHEAASRTFKKKLSSVPPWEDPELLALIAALPADETPIPSSRVKTKKATAERHTAQPLDAAKRLQARIEILAGSLARTEPGEVEETYGEARREIQRIIQGLEPNPTDPDLIKTLRELERRYE